MNIAKAGFDSQVNEPWASSVFGPTEMSTIDRMLSTANLREGMRVIEPGCGTGRLTSILVDLVGPTGFVFASDISAKMIEAAHRRIGSRENVSIRQIAIEGYQFDPKSFDAVICHNVFPHFDDKPAAVNHVAGALKKSGKFIVFHFMNSAGINDLHRKVDPSVLNDLLPPELELREIFAAGGLQIELIKDDDSGFLLSATRT